MTTASLYPDPSMPGFGVYFADILLSSSSHFLRWRVVQFFGRFPSVTIFRSTLFAKGILRGNISMIRVITTAPLRCESIPCLQRAIRIQ